MFAEDERIHLCGRCFQSAGEVAAESRRIELRAKTDDALPRQAAALHGQIRQHIDWVTDHD